MEEVEQFLREGSTTSLIWSQIGKSNIEKEVVIDLTKSSDFCMKRDKSKFFVKDYCANPDKIVCECMMSCSGTYEPLDLIVCECMHTLKLYYLGEAHSICTS